MLLGFAIAILAFGRADASTAPNQSITVWENVWQDSGSLQVAKADQAAPSYDDTQWTAVGPGSGSGENGCCQDGGYACSNTQASSCEGGSFFPGATCSDNGCVTEQPVCCQGLRTGQCVYTLPSNINLPASCETPCLDNEDCDGGFCDHGQECEVGTSSVCTDTIHPAKCFLLGGSPVAGSACQIDDGQYCGQPIPSTGEFCCACNGVGPFANTCFEANTPETCAAAGCEPVANGACDPVTELCVTSGCHADSDCDDNTACTIDSCDPNDPQADNDGCVFTDKVCDDESACNGIETCSELDGSCVPGAEVICEDGNVCNGVSTCTEPGGACTTPDNLSCDDGNTCTTDSCDPIDGCSSTPTGDNASCDDGDACTDGSTCSDGECIGGGPITCTDDNNACTIESCDAELGCVSTVADESPSCGSCDDGLDNDNDGDVDGEDCDCTTLCAQQRFALVTTFVPSNFKRYAFYSGSDVKIDSDPSDPPFPTGGICVTNGDYRAGINVGFIATNGSSRFGKGVTLDPDLVDDPNDAIDLGSTRNSIIRQSYVSDGDPIIYKDTSPPYVGPGTCSQDAMVSCVIDADCGMGNNCQNQLTLADPNNPNVITDGSDETYTRCQTAQATVAGEATQIAGIAGNVFPYKGGQKVIKTSKNDANVVITVGAGLQVVYVKSVRVSGNTTLTFQRDPLAVGDPTTLIIRVARQIRLGGNAQIILDGIDPDMVIWNAEGPTGGRPKLQKQSTFVGTLIASERRGVFVGGAVNVQGAIKARRIHIGQESVITHIPSKVLLP